MPGDDPSQLMTKINTEQPANVIMVVIIRLRNGLGGDVPRDGSSHAGSRAIAPREMVFQPPMLFFSHIDAYCHTLTCILTMLIGEHLFCWGVRRRGGVGSASPYGGTLLPSFCRWHHPMAPTSRNALS